MSPPPYTTILLCPLHTVSTVYCIHCIHCEMRPLCGCIHLIHWFDLFAPKTMSPPPYTTIPLQTASTAPSCLTFLHERQCPHHHIPLFYCILHTPFTASSGLTFLYQRQCPHHHIPLFYWVHCVLRPHHRVTFV